MEYLQANPAWITSAMFLLTFGESIVILGLFIPASLVMPGIGALAAAVGIGPVEILFYASLGMIIGDTVSYVIGLIIGTRIETWVPNQYQKQLSQAKQFMNKYGILSVALGRFLGPLRCLVPMTAGSLGMRFSIFAPVEILSAPVWTGLYVLSGYFLGGVFIENFLIGMGVIFVIIFVYSIWKDPFGLMKQAREHDEK